MIDHGVTLINCVSLRVRVPRCLQLRERRTLGIGKACYAKCSFPMGFVLVRVSKPAQLRKRNGPFSKLIFANWTLVVGFPFPALFFVFLLN